MVREFEDAAFSLKKGETTQQPVKSDFGFHIIRVDDIREAVTVSFKDVEHSVAKAMIEDEKAAKAAEASAVAALAAMKAGKALHEIYPPEPSGEGSKKDEGRIYSKETGMFAKSGGYLPGVGIAQDLVDDAFAATKENPVLGKVYKSGQRFLVAVLKEKAAVQKADFEKEKDAFRQKAAFSRQAAVINDWVKAMRESAKVDINTDLVSYDVKPERERNPDQY
jgi:parvulin-like peptidyl-prolyl isomerase